MIQQTMLFLWNLLDSLYYRCTRLTYIEKGKNIFRIAIKKYHGEELVTRDGHSLKKGDRYAQLHLHNARLAKLLRQSANNEFAWALTLKRQILSSLPGLVHFFQQHPKAKEIRVILGTTFLHKRVERLGFDVAPIKNPWLRMIKTLRIHSIFLFCHPYGFSEFIKRKNMLVPKRIYISVDQLHQLYGAENHEPSTHLD